MRLALLTVALTLAPLVRAQGSDRFAGVPDGAVLVAEHLPLTNAVLRDDEVGRRFLRAHARRALYPHTIGTAEHLLEAFALRDSLIAHLDPRVEPYFQAVEAFDLVLGFMEEVKSIGLLPAAAEGFVFGVGPGPYLPTQTEVLAPPDFALFTAFQAALSQSRNGEYPFTTMDDHLDLVVLGERLVFGHPESPYAEAVRDDFEQAVLLFMSLHRTGDAWLVGPATTEFYPWASTDEAHRRFLDEHAESRYHTAVAALLKDPPEAADEVEAVVVATGPYAAMERLVLDALAAGTDLLTVVPPAEPAASSAAVYRYYPVGDPRIDRADDAAHALGFVPERRRLRAGDGYGG